jgi:phosphoribosyl 1,2-cyclic phosphodiesterase
MDVSVIASGSNGNCCLVETDSTSVLIDAGKSMKEIEERLKRMGKSLENLDGVLLTHAHIDHYLGIGPIARKYNIPVYLTKKTYSHCKAYLGHIKPIHFKPDDHFMINGVLIEPVLTSHDIPSTGFRIGKFGLFTDTGIVTDHMKKVIGKLDAALLESNHDIDMLINGPYPPALKHRILADTGHLSNFDASTFIHEKGNHLQWVLLGHLSGNNNTPQIAKKTFETLVKKKVEYEVLSRDEQSGVWQL